MSVKGTIKEGAGFLKKEAGEAAGSTKTALEGRALRNEGRLENGKMPKVTPPGTDN